MNALFKIENERMIHGIAQEVGGGVVSVAKTIELLGACGTKSYMQVLTFCFHLHQLLTQDI